MQDGSAGDPASNCPAVMLASQIRHDLDYTGAANDQIQFLLKKVPRTPDNAISHRVAELQLWNDNLYMVPPCFAYYGIVTKNQTLLYEAYNQIKLYRSHLRDTSPQYYNLWKHVLLGPWTDDAHWATGHGWAAAGMLRVLGTIQNSEYSNSMISEQEDLVSWVQEIHDGVYPFLDEQTNLFKNYVSDPLKPPANSTDPTGNFYDAASTALIASTVYRLALLRGVYSHIPNAERCREAIFAPGPAFNQEPSFPLSSMSPPTSTSALAPASISGSVSPSLLLSKIEAPTMATPTTTPQKRGSHDPQDEMRHIDENGWLHPVVNPHKFRLFGSHSAEGQAFVVQLHSSWRDWVAAGEPGKYAEAR